MPHLDKIPSAFWGSKVMSVQVNRLLATENTLPKITSAKRIEQLRLMHHTLVVWYCTSRLGSRKISDWMGESKMDYIGWERRWLPSNCTLPERLPRQDWSGCRSVECPEMNGERTKFSGSEVDTYVATVLTCVTRLACSFTNWLLTVFYVFRLHISNIWVRESA